MKRVARRSAAKLICALISLAVATLGALTVASPKADAAISISYTALGDSIAFGAFAPLGEGYVPRYKNYIQADTGAFVSLANLGVPGWTSADLRDATHNRAFFRLSIYLSKVVTVNIGGNDLNAARNLYKAGACGGGTNQQCLVDAVAAFKSNWDGILQDLFALRNNKATVFRTMTVYNPFVDEDRNADSYLFDGGLTDLQALKPYIEEVNNHINASAAQGVLVAQVYDSFNGAGGNSDPADQLLLSFDGFHPNGRGHARIAGLLRGLLYSTVTP